MERSHKTMKPLFLHGAMNALMTRSSLPSPLPFLTLPHLTKGRKGPWVRKIRSLLLSGIVPEKNVE